MLNLGPLFLEERPPPPTKESSTHTLRRHHHTYALLFVLQAWRAQPLHGYQQKRCHCFRKKIDQINILPPSRASSRLIDDSLFPWCATTAAGRLVLCLFGSYNKREAL